jgi:hypothetical protein
MVSSSSNSSGISNRKVSPVREYKEFANLKRKDIEQYVLDRLPLPTATERFNWEESKAREAALLAQVKSWSRHMSRRQIGYRVLSLAISLTLILIAYSIGIWWITIPVILLAIRVQYKFSDFGWRHRLHYRTNIEWLENTDFFIDNLHLKRLHKWALDRYDFDPDKDDFTSWSHEIGEKFYLEKDGPLSGCIVSSTTGQEWPLKPI